jgi:transposase
MSLMNRYTVILTEDERKSLCELASKGKHNSQQILNALILLNCDKSELNVNYSINEEISRVLNISMKKIDRVKKRFVEEGLEVALNGQESDRIYTKKVDGDAEAHLVALSCSQPPEGFARWSLRLLADKAVELGYFEDISHETVRRTLKKRNQTLAKERMGNSPRTKQ